MALIHCHECGKQISDQAASCPHCGFPIHQVLTKQQPLKAQYHSDITRSGMHPAWIVILSLLGFTVVLSFALALILPDDNKTKSAFFEQIIPNKVLVNESEMQLQEDQYRGWKITLDEPTTVIIEHSTVYGPEIDVYFIDADDYDRWGDILEDVSYYPGLTTLGTRGSKKEGIVSSGDYYVLADNTDRGTIPPMNFDNDIATFDIRVELE